MEIKQAQEKKETQNSNKTPLDEKSHRGGVNEKKVEEKSASSRARYRRAKMGSSLPTPPAMESGQQGTKLASKGGKR
jgi:hypothetical protein